MAHALWRTRVGTSLSGADAELALLPSALLQVDLPLLLRTGGDWRRREQSARDLHPLSSSTTAPGEGFLGLALSGVQGRSPWWGSGATPQRAARQPQPSAEERRGGPGGGGGTHRNAWCLSSPPGGCGVRSPCRRLNRCPIVLLPGARHDAARPASAQREGSPSATNRLRVRTTNRHPNRHPQIDMEVLSIAVWRRGARQTALIKIGVEFIGGAHTSRQHRLIDLIATNLVRIRREMMPDIFDPQNRQPRLFAHLTLERA